MRSKWRVGYPNISRLSTSRPYSNFNPWNLKIHQSKKDSKFKYMLIRCHYDVTHMLLVLFFFLLNNLFTVPLGPKRVW